MEDVGLIEGRDGDLTAAETHLDEARRCYGGRDDVLRATLEEADVFTKHSNPKRALELVRDALTGASDAPAAPLLRKLEEDLRTSGSSEQR